jgi:hypothetical protein
MTEPEDRDYTAWTDLMRDNPEQAADDLDTLNKRETSPLRLMLNEDAADRLHGGEGTIPRP